MATGSRIGSELSRVSAPQAAATDSDAASKSAAPQTVDDQLEERRRRLAATGQDTTQISEPVITTTKKELIEEQVLGHKIQEFLHSFTLNGETYFVGLDPYDQLVVTTDRAQIDSQTLAKIGSDFTVSNELQLPPEITTIVSRTLQVGNAEVSNVRQETGKRAFIELTMTADRVDVTKEADQAKEKYDLDTILALFLPDSKALFSTISSNDSEKICLMLPNPKNRSELRLIYLYNQREVQHIAFTEGSDSDSISSRKVAAGTLRSIIDQIMLEKYANDQQIQQIIGLVRTSKDYTDEAADGFNRDLMELQAIAVYEHEKANAQDQPQGTLQRLLSRSLKGGETVNSAKIARSINKDTIASLFAKEETDPNSKKPIITEAQAQLQLSEIRKTLENPQTDQETILKNLDALYNQFSLTSDERDYMLLQEALSLVDTAIARFQNKNEIRFGNNNYTYPFDLEDADRNLPRSQKRGEANKTAITESTNFTVFLQPFRRRLMQNLVRLFPVKKMDPFAGITLALEKSNGGELTQTLEAVNRVFINADQATSAEDRALVNRAIEILREAQQKFGNQTFREHTMPFLKDQNDSINGATLKVERGEVTKVTMTNNDEIKFADLMNLYIKRLKAKTLSTDPKVKSTGYDVHYEPGTSIEASRQVETAFKNVDQLALDFGEKSTPLEVMAYVNSVWEISQAAKTQKNIDVMRGAIKRINSLLKNPSLKLTSRQLDGVRLPFPLDKNQERNLYGIFGSITQDLTDTNHIRSDAQTSYLDILKVYAIQLQRELGKVEITESDKFAAVSTMEKSAEMGADLSLEWVRDVWEVANRANTADQIDQAIFMITKYQSKMKLPPNVGVSQDTEFPFDLDSQDMGNIEADKTRLRNQIGLDTGIQIYIKNLRAKKTKLLTSS